MFWPVTTQYSNWKLKLIGHKYLSLQTIFLTILSDTRVRGYKGKIRILHHVWEAKLIHQ